jgi:hypothetical protein
MAEVFWVKHELSQRVVQIINFFSRAKGMETRRQDPGPFRRGGKPVIRTAMKDPGPEGLRPGIARLLKRDGSPTAKAGIASSGQARPNRNAARKID